MCCRLHHPRRCDGIRASGSVRSLAESQAIAGGARAARAVRSRPSSCDRLEQRQPPVATLDRGVERGHRLARLHAERLDRGPEIDRVDGPVARARRARSTASSTSRDPFGRRDHSPTTRARSRSRPRRRTGTPSGRRSAPSVDRALLARCAIAAADDVVRRCRSPKRARRHAARPARRARRAASRRIHSPFIQSSFFAVEARGRVRHAVEVELPRPARRATAPRRRRRLGRPSEQREVVRSAPRGGSPRSRKSSSATAPWRFDSLARTRRRR